MPLVTLTLRSGHDTPFKDAVLAATHRALVAAGVPVADRFHRVLELGADDFRFDPHYPDLASPRGKDFVMIEILLSAGRSLKVKRAIVNDLIAQLREAPGLDPEHVMLCFVETTWESWSFGGGRFAYA
jgi:hypothetical protein